MIYYTLLKKNIWTLLYFTGYLTKMFPKDIPEKLGDGSFALTIPNTEIKRLFQKSVNEWYLAKTEASDRSELFDALWKGDAERLQEYLNDTLFDTISFYDYQENFYHAFLAGQLSWKGYVVKSNRENGLGCSDITVKDRKNRRAIVIETKVTGSESDLDSLCDKALTQIVENQYNKEIEQSGYQQVLCIGIAFYRKQCRVKVAD